MKIVDIGRAMAIRAGGCEMKIFPVLIFQFFSLYVFLDIYNHQYNMIGNILQVVMLLCLIYEHGFKIYYKNGKRKYL